MNDDFTLHEDELSEEDLAILRAFDARDKWETDNTTPLPESSSQPGIAYSDDDEMLLLFLSEAQEDISKLQRDLQNIKQSKQLSPAHFLGLQRAAHKLRGTSAAVGYNLMSTVAGHIEIIAEQIGHGLLTPELGSTAISLAVPILDICLQELVETGQEPADKNLINQLEIAYRDLKINLERPIAKTIPQKAQVAKTEQAETAESTPPPTSALGKMQTDPVEGNNSYRISTQQLLASTPGTTFMRIDARRFDKLLQHTEQLAEQRARLENAQEQVAQALKDLQAAQERVLYYETTISTFFLHENVAHIRGKNTSPSLIARILHEAKFDSSLEHTRKPRTSLYAQKKSNWDELDMERYTERDKIINAMREAIANVSACISRLMAANNRMNTIYQESIQHVSGVRKDTLLLRLAPLRTLMPRIQQEISKSALVQKHEIYFDVIGEEIEINQDVLEILAPPLLQVFRTCIVDIGDQENHQQVGKPYHTWLHAHSIGNEVTIKIGFSMAVHGGVVEILREPLQHLNGTITLQRNATGGISFILRFPRSHGTDSCLLVKVGQQQVMIPTAQIQRVGDRTQEEVDRVYHLHQLLGYPVESEANQPRIKPILILHTTNPLKTTGILIDEIIDEVAWIVRPLPAYLQRPGLIGAAVAGQNNVILLLDIPALIRNYLQHIYNDEQNQEHGEQVQSYQKRQPGILVADDSVFLRQSVIQTLREEKYQIFEAKDGLDAMEQLLKHIPDVFLLDVEMPNLNGYDLLNMMRIYPELSNVKIIMLTSRSSEKHMRRALDLGAHAYLTKPAPRDILLATVQRMVAQDTKGAREIHP